MASLSSREMEIFVVALKYAIQLDRCCPDVGMGPSGIMLAREVADKLSFAVSFDDLHKAVNAVGR